MPDLYTLAADRRRDVLAQDAALRTDLLAAAAQAWATIRERLTVVTAAIQAERDAGGIVSPAWLEAQGLLQELDAQVAVTVGPLLAAAATLIERTEAAALLVALQDTAAQLAPWGVTLAAVLVWLPTAQQAIGTLADGTPLRDWLGALATTTVTRVQDALLAAVLLGATPSGLVAAVRQAVGRMLADLLTLARSEVFRVVREALGLVYQEHSDVVSGWVWLAKRDTRTCGFCWAMHGSVHRLSERMVSHPRCRCTQAPKLRAIAGIPEPGPLPEAGPVLFAKLPADQQRAILGPGKHQAYQDGRLALEDLIGHRRDSRWGRVGYERSLKDALAAAARRTAAAA